MGCVGPHLEPSQTIPARKGAHGQSAAMHLNEDRVFLTRPDETLHRAAVHLSAISNF